MHATGRVLTALGVAFLATVALRLTVPGGVLWWLAATLTTVAVLSLARTWALARTRRRRPAVPDRPGWRTHAVRADAKLRTTLRSRGIPADGVHAGTRLTLAWSATHVELWHDEEAIASFPWGDVTRVLRGRAAVGLTGRPAVALVLRGDWLLLAPCRRAEGSHGTASFEDVGTLVIELLEVRDAARSPKPSPPPARVVQAAEDDDGRRAVDVELSTLVHGQYHRYGGDLELRADERPGELDVPWTREDLGVAGRHIFHVVHGNEVPLEPRAGVGEDARRVCDHLLTLYPGLSAEALHAVWDYYCFMKR